MQQSSMSKFHFNFETFNPDTTLEEEGESLNKQASGLQILEGTTWAQGWRGATQTSMNDELPSECLDKSWHPRA